MRIMGEGTVREVQKEKSLRYRSKRFFIDLIQGINVIKRFKMSSNNYE